MPITVRQATIHDLDLVAPLFDAYRQFYKQPGDIDRARQFLAQRFQHHESVILLAFHGEAPVGFTQLYPVFSSVRTARTYLLNDLYVAPEARRHGVAGALLDAAEAHGRAMGVVGLSLSTAHDNLTAQRLYESKGWVLDLEFREYSLTL
ncbi:MULTISPECIES: GNAT family N-acetyltransferase [Dyella]|uniref:GNAT family N-acetyltransferase n=2 Tax=Dyella TaxID=231454 RepID=A0A4R0YSY0_9GAMM|nr:MULTISPECIES: GNAT family N-acetyltransferase [Dyella]TBR39974.1 GNAT family N-acetyltransferase [Dyella terrae]TCI12445.1 GNAT family N-acetyltransferase [Dyella soli]